MVLAQSPDIHILMVAKNSLSTVLEHEGYRSVGIQAYVATNFSEVKKTLEKFPVDALLIDWEYSALDPFEIVSYIRASEEHHSLPIIITSVHSCDDRIGKYKNIDLFIRQPVPRVILLEKIRRLLHKKSRDHDRVDLGELYLKSVKVKSGDHNITMTIGDISSTGIFLYSEKMLNPGDTVFLKFHLPGLRDEIDVEGNVVRVTRMHKINDKMNKGLAIQFTKFMGKSEESLNTFLHDKKPDSNFMSYYL